MKGIERIWPAMVSCSSSVNGGWRKKREGSGGEEGSALVHEDGLERGCTLAVHWRGTPRRRRAGHGCGRQRKEVGGSDMWAPQVRSPSTFSHLGTLAV